MDIQRINELLDNDDFAVKLANASSIEEVQKLFSINGVELSEDEIVEIIRVLSDVVSMSDEELEHTVGGLCTVCPDDISAPNILKSSMYITKNVIPCNSENDVATIKVPISLIKNLYNSQFHFDCDLLSKHESNAE